MIYYEKTKTQENEDKIKYVSNNASSISNLAQIIEPGDVFVYNSLDDKGKAVFNYKINIKNYEKSLLRLKYPGLMIEKTVDATDNNNVNLNDDLTYTIKITNKSDATYNGNTYPDFKINESISDYVTYTSSTNN